MTKIFISAGEASGDLHAAALIHALRARQSGLCFFGLGGERMRSEGAELLYDLRSLAVAGFWEVAKRILHFRRVFHSALDAVDREKPSLAILVDYPGLNLRLADQLHRRGIKVVYYIVPQVWAWKPGRIKQIEERVDLLLPILPFEKQLFDSTRIKCEFVGHPLLDFITPESDPIGFRNRHAIDSEAKIIALLPGSRETEISRHYRPMLEAVSRLHKNGTALTPFVVVRDEIDPSLYRVAEEAMKLRPIHVCEERYDLLKSADVSLVTSGTATLEAALCGKPFCVVYKTGWITYQIAKRVIELKNVALVNIVAGETLVPEFLQSDLTPDNLVSFCRKIFSEPAAAQQMIEKLKTVRARLGKPGAVERAAAAIVSEIPT